MTKTHKNPVARIPQDVPGLISTKFIEELRKTSISPDVIERLEKALAPESTPSESAIKTALFLENQEI